jgi:hypothetical protein
MNKKMHYCPLTRELCKHVLVKDRTPYACVYDGILRIFKDIKKCPENTVSRDRNPSSDTDNGHGRERSNYGERSVDR